MRQPAYPTDHELLALSDAASIKRGAGYARSGAVEITSRSELQVTAIVSGSEDYTVRLRLSPHLAASQCSCPAFAKGLFCKHLIATAIVARNPPNDSEADSDLHLMQKVSF
jgi:uncharacterized Zn finger protein